MGTLEQRVPGRAGVTFTKLDKLEGGGNRLCTLLYTLPLTGASLGL